ncbi:MAG: calcium/sodium antiporter [Candidatus Woesearchaeota archaeon]
MILVYVLFALGFALVVKGAGWLVDGASAIAKRFNVPDLVIGLTIVAFGTSAPELAVNIFSSISGNTDIAIGNILGSNTFNILLILGISALIYPIAVGKGTVWKEIPMSLLAAVLVGILANDAFFSKNGVSALGKIDGIVFLAFFAVFLYYTFGVAKHGRNDKDGLDIKKIKIWHSALMIGTGLVMLFIGGKWVVNGAVEIARYFGVTESLIGLTIVAAGTSLPELATSAVAAYKKNCDIAVGNIVGSNIFNIFLILGVSSLIRPLPFGPGSIVDIIMACFASLILFIWMFFGKKRILERWQGIVMIVIYIAYVAYLVMRG